MLINYFLNLETDLNETTIHFKPLKKTQSILKHAAIQTLPESVENVSSRCFVQSYCSTARDAPQHLEALNCPQLRHVMVHRSTTPPQPPEAPLAIRPDMVVVSSLRYHHVSQTK